MKIMKKKPKLFVTWLLSYLIILLLPVITSLVITDSYSKKMEQQTYDVNYRIAEAMADNIKDVLISIRRFYAEIAFHEDLEAILSVRAEDEQFSPEAQSFLNWFGRNSVYKNNYERAYIYLPDTDTVISENGVYPGRFYYDTYFDSAVISYEEWKMSHFVEGASYNIMPGARDVSSVEPTELMTYHMAFPKTILQKFGNVSFSVVVKKTDFFKRIPENNWLSYCDIYIFDNNGRLFYDDASYEPSPPDLNTLVKRGQDENSIVQINHIVYDTINMTLATVGHKSLMFREFSKMRTVSVLATTFCILLGVIMAWYFIRRDYKPIRELLALCGISGQKNEYERIRSSLEESFVKTNALSQIAEKYKTSLRALALAKFLKGSYTAQEAEQVLEEYEITLFDEAVMVFAFNSGEFGEFLPEENLSEEQKIVEVRFIITNIFEEIFNTAQSAGYIVDMDGTVFFVASAQTANREFFDEIISYGLSAIQQYFALELTVAASGIHSGREGLPLAYSEAAYVSEYKRMRNLPQTVWFPDLEKTTAEGYHFSLEKEQKLNNLIQMGDKEDAVDYVCGLFDEIEADQTLSLEDVKVLMLDISAAVLKLQGTLLSGDDNIGAEQLLACKTLGDLRQEVLRFLDAFFAESRMDGEIKFDAIRSYIEENYENPNLNINSIGDHFGVYPAYLSQLFKKACGTAMVDYINHYRVGMAKKLMEETELTIAEISCRVGYGHIRTFNRVFKKYEGVTPSAYRNSLHRH